MVSEIDVSEPLLEALDSQLHDKSPPRAALSRECSVSALRLLEQQETCHGRVDDKPRVGSITGVSIVMWSMVALLVLAIPLAFRAADDGRPPACRKSAALAVRSTLHNHSELIIWSGMGHGEHLFQDMYSFSLDTRRWKRRHPGTRHSRNKLPPAPAVPAARWKAGVAQSSQPDGMFLIDGDSPSPLGKDVYDGDAWLLRLPELQWERANSSSAVHSRPQPRRAHTTSLLAAPGRSSSLVLYGGRLKNKQMMSDVWLGSMAAWPNVSWTRLYDPAQAPHTSYPPPRKGHTAVVAVSPDGPQLVIFGGRNNSAYFNDVWAFSLARQVWEELTPMGPSPLPRDHHGVALAGSRMFVYGGRSGQSHDTATPLADVWVLDLVTRTWQRLPLEHGLRPLPRFLFSYAQYTTDGGTETYLVVFGGQTGAGCKLNDVWQLNLATMDWRKLASNVWSRKRCRRLYG